MDNIFPNVDTREDIAVSLDIKLKWLTYVLYGIKEEMKYSSFQIPKKSGGFREICAPCEELKQIQRKLAKLLYNYQQEVWAAQDNKLGKNRRRVLSHGFEKNRGIKTNAVSHIRKRYVINMDLENFFDSFHIGRVCGFFEKNRDYQIGHKAAATIAHLVCYRRTLPQGAPTSPVITNLICQTLDIHLWKIAKEYRLDYTRYADDLTFSTNDSHFLERFENFLRDVTNEIQKMGFAVNEKKTRILFRDSKQTVTGLVVNQKIHVDREYYRKTRAMAFNLYTKGEFFIDDVSGTIQQLEGRFAFIYQIERFNKYPFLNLSEYPETEDWNADKDYIESKQIVKNFNLREKDYQEFLFYKNFYANEKPLILCEGKTDAVYLKAAMRSLYAEYPNLVKKGGNPDKPKYSYAVSFFRRTTTIQTLFECSPTGASAYDYIVQCFSNSNKRDWIPLLYNRFRDLTGRMPKHPVVILLDHEWEKDKPLKQFFNIHKLANQKSLLENQLFCKVVENANLYLMTYKLLPGKDSCEIEDLLPKHILEIEIEGRTFDPHEKKGDPEHFGKKTMAQYVTKHQSNIDFSAFKSVFDTLNELISDYEQEQIQE